MTQIKIIKIGGNIIDSTMELEQFLLDFALIEGPKILVHGGGVMASQMAKSMGIEPQMHQGRRITDAETLKLVTMVYAGWINKSIVAKLQQKGVDALGLSGADANTVPAVMRSKEPIDFGYVGDVDPEKINVRLILNLISRGIVPVFCAITHDKNGTLLNTNADTMASSIAIALSKEYSTSLVYCLEKKGVLNDVNNPDSVIPLINSRNYHILKNSGVIKDGMIPKLDNAFNAIDNGVYQVCIKHASNLSNDFGTILKK